MLSHFPKLKKVTSLQDMRNFGLSVAKETLTKLTKMDGNRNALFLLSGDAGVGKTSFAQAFIGACIQASPHIPHVKYNKSIDGSDGNLPTIPSPTFCLINEYWCDALKIPINHMDLYRLENPTKETLETISIPAIFENSISLVEWPDRLEHAGVALGKPYVNLHFAYHDDHEQHFHDSSSTSAADSASGSYDIDFDLYERQTRIVTVDCVL